MCSLIDISSVPARLGDALHSPTTPPGSPPDDYPSTSKPGEKPTDKMSKLMKGDLSKAGAGDYVSSKLEALNISVSLSAISHHGTNINTHPDTLISW